MDIIVVKCTIISPVRIPVQECKSGAILGHSVSNILVCFTRAKFWVCRINRIILIFKPEMQHHKLPVTENHVSSV